MTGIKVKGLSVFSWELGFDEHGLALHSPSFPLHGSPNVGLRLLVAIDQTAASKPSPSVTQLVLRMLVLRCEV